MMRRLPTVPNKVEILINSTYGIGVLCSSVLLSVC